MSCIVQDGVVRAIDELEREGDRREEDTQVWSYEDVREAGIAEA